MSGLSPCVEWLFADRGTPFADRIRRAAASGFTHVEFWGARDKDLGALEAAIAETGVTVTGFVSEPTGRIVDPATHDEFLAGLEKSCALAHRLDARALIVVSGDDRAGVQRREQLEALTLALRRASSIAKRHGITLLLEPLNTRIDHRGYFLDSTSDALTVIREVGSPAVKLLFDMYHSIVMEEDPATVLRGAGNLIGHVHIADAPGRHEPGTGTIDWPRQLAAIRDAGYSGPLGLEYVPTKDTLSSLALIRALA